MHIYTRELLGTYLLSELKKIALGLGITPAGNKTRRETWIAALVGQPFPLFQSIAPEEPVENFLDADRVQELIENFFGVEVDPVSEPIVEAAKYSPGVEVDPVSEPIVQVVKNSPGVEVDPIQDPSAPVAKNSPGVERALELIENLPSVNLAAKNLPGSRSKASTAHQLLELFKCSAHIIKDSPGVKTEVTVSESAIGSAAKNPILTGVTLSDRFLARYSLPQAQIIHFQSDADGQLSLLDFKLQMEPEPPDPDDFESIEEFREDLARWDREHPEELAVSLDSFCEWVPCPDTWYESAEVVEVAPSVAIESSITCNFFIPTFDEECDRFNRSDEPPDTGIYARLPKPNPPSFPPMALGQAHTKRSLNPAQTHPKLISNSSQTHTHCIAAGSSTQPARSPPSGDAGF
ncbi:hypothetical protein Q5692_35625 [Microcoleus sp. C2C3]|uniref:hypothetical protein n=1 Tax=unclassified Microcoleus TaxID=2642155 RepID=UPI002FCFD66F